MSEMDRLNRIRTQQPTQRSRKHWALALVIVFPMIVIYWVMAHDTSPIPKNQIYEDRKKYPDKYRRESIEHYKERKRKEYDRAKRRESRESWERSEAGAKLK